MILILTLYPTVQDTMLLEQIVQAELIFENICSLLPQALDASKFLISINMHMVNLNYLILVCSCLE